jgi:hypothetical protein
VRTCAGAWWCGSRTSALKTTQAAASATTKAAPTAAITTEASTRNAKF